ncbi:sulfatase-like hydrolase/transferase [Saccharicrinis aurantiacus]|uniref:sulfatase-like hydrolase/transferase n=1 Tax=Saccharicrinis aurantiacus TaxID=1849719 RepID=UPI00094F8A3D|nr:sulfatase-like hydrolase/transferase [Saccharicrinis aurantiacus]
MRMKNSKLLLLIVAIVFAGINLKAQEIIHDAEYYILEAQHGDQWASEDSELQKKLAKLRKKYGTPPNIIHIMWDDMPVGEIGIPALQKNRGFETPVMNKIAEEGILMTRMITEPSCTPSRAAAITGRHAVRSSMTNVAFPYEYGGIAAEEEFMSEVLSKAGYATAFYGKAHLGDVESSYLTNQGFDEAFWTPYNQVPSLYVRRGQQAALYPTSMYPDMYPEDKYSLDDQWIPKGFVWALEGKKGGPVSEWGNTESDDDYYKIDPECVKRAKAFMAQSKEQDKPFYIAYWPMMQSFLGNQPGTPNNTTSGALPQEGYVKVDGYVGEIMAELKKLGLEENTLVVLMADNGPMTHNGPQGMIEHIYRGGKGDFTEGAVRVPAIIKWEGVIDEGQVVGDMFHITDLYTTFANIADAKQYIPTDRIIDGLDQTSLLLNGDGFGRRDYAFIYTGPILAATVKGRFKRHWIGELPGLSGAAFYDLYNDPREVNGKMLPGFTTKGMFTEMKLRHELWTLKYPNRAQSRDFPFKGIENASPNVKDASQPRINPDDLPFDPREFIKAIPEWEDTERLW